MALLDKKNKDANTETVKDQAESTATQGSASVATSAGSSIALRGGVSPFITNEAFVEAVADADYRSVTSIVASNGSHMTAGDKPDDLGKVLKFQAITVKESKRVAPGSNDEEAKDYFQVSDDGETVADGRSLNEALQDAIEAGYSKAAIKTYIIIYCIITDCDNEDYIGETVALQLAPTSQFTWKPLATKLKLKAAAGKLKVEPVLGDESLGSAVIFTSTATAASWQGNNFTKFEFTV